MRGSGQRLPITLRFTRVLGTFSHTTCFPFSCALWACFSDRSVSGERSEPIGALMPHVAFWVVQRLADCIQRQIVEFQCRTRLCGWCNKNIKTATKEVIVVSMPHAALCVVQPAFLLSVRSTTLFQCRTRLCVWCSITELGLNEDEARRFNAARGFVCGAASSLAALVPLGGKSPFGKSPKI